MAKKKKLRTHMYHFRMDPDDEREAGAEAILKSYINDEIGVREVVTAALYALEGRDVLTSESGHVFARKLNILIGEIALLSQRMNEISVIRSSGQMTPEIEEEAISVSRRLQQNVTGLISPERSYD